MKLLKIGFAIILPLLFTSCGTTKKAAAPQQRIYNINLECNATPDTHYSNLTHGIDVYVSSSLTDRAILDVSECSYVP